MSSKPVINEAFARSQLNNNEPLLLKLLGKFVDEYRYSADDIEYFLTHGDNTAAKRLAHTVKGITGNLGIEQAYEAARELDARLKIGTVHPDILANYRTSIEVAIEHIGSMCGSSSDA